MFEPFVSPSLVNEFLPCSLSFSVLINFASWTGSIRDSSSKLFWRDPLDSGQFCTTDVVLGLFTFDLFVRLDRSTSGDNGRSSWDRFFESDSVGAISRLESVYHWLGLSGRIRPNLRTKIFSLKKLIPYFSNSHLKDRNNRHYSFLIRAPRTDSVHQSGHITCPPRFLSSSESSVSVETCSWLDKTILSWSVITFWAESIFKRSHYLYVVSYTLYFSNLNSNFLFIVDLEKSN